MNIESIKKKMEEEQSMATTLGMKFLSTPEADTCASTMPVDKRTCQPFGMLNGGASLALAENLAGLGSLALCPGYRCMGINVNGNHIKPAFMGDTVTATATIVHRGHTLHVWRVDVRDGVGDIVSTITVTNFMVKE